MNRAPLAIPVPPHRTCEQCGLRGAAAVELIRLHRRGGYVGEDRYCVPCAHEQAADLRECGYRVTWHWFLTQVFMAPCLRVLP